MSRPDAERALKIYKVFTSQTSDVVEFLQAARRVEVSTRLQIPNIKHAPTSLTSSLEEYLQDPDFEVNRRQYLAQKQAKENGGAQKQAPAAPAKTSPAQPGPTPTAAPQPAAKEPPKIAPDLIDFFESIETEQTPMFGNQQAPQQIPQITGPAPQIVVNPYHQQQQQQPFATQPQMPPPPMVVPAPLMPSQTGGFPTAFHQTNPFPQPIQEIPAQTSYPRVQDQSQVQAHFTGTGFGGYTPQDQQQLPVPEIQVPPVPPQFAPQQQQQQLPSFQQPPPPAALQIPSQTGTNPFRQSMLMNTGAANFATSPPPPQPKSTNPFTRTTQTSPTTLSATAGAPGPAPQSPPQGSVLGRAATTAGTSTNPFSRNTNTSPQATGGSALSVPGGTNPFRTSMMLQQQQAQQQAQMQGNFSGQTGTMGGLETLETVPVFPRSNTTAGNPPTQTWQ